MALIYLELGREEEARASVREVLRIFPGASIEDSRQRCLYKGALLEWFLDGLRKAGMPEGEPGAEPMMME